MTERLTYGPLFHYKVSECRSVTEGRTLAGDIYITVQGKYVYWLYCLYTVFSIHGVISTGWFKSKSQGNAVIIKVRDWFVTRKVRG